MNPLNSGRRIRLSAIRRTGTTLLATLGFLAAAPSAHAVPSFARQTGADCAACHVGAYGPQLTPYGIKFKLGGYTETDAALTPSTSHPKAPLHRKSPFRPQPAVG